MICKKVYAVVRRGFCDETPYFGEVVYEDFGTAMKVVVENNAGREEGDTWFYSLHEFDVVVDGGDE